MKPEVFTINGNSFSSTGQWGAGFRNSRGRWSQLVNAVFDERFTAECFCEIWPEESIGLDICIDPECEQALAGTLAKFIDQWDEEHGDDERYPTISGRYPTAREMARFWHEAKPQIAA